MAVPFAVRRPWLLARGLLANRDRPDLAQLGAIVDPEEFVWAILPHAARSFSACIVLLPSSSALPSAVAYLYCRMLDTYEDLVPDREAREAALQSFAQRLEEAVHGAAAPPPPPAITASTCSDERDRAHLLLVERCGLVDLVFAALDPARRRIVADLVRDMSEGMAWSSATFHAQGGVLRGEAQLTRYCRAVLGNPVVFVVRLLRIQHGSEPELTAEEREDSMRVGELVQLANVTRDVEKDLARGIAYDESLAPDLSRMLAEHDGAAVERIRSARIAAMRLALSRAPSYRRMVEAMRLPAWSFARASAVLMFLFTEQHYRRLARRDGGTGSGAAWWTGPESVPALLWRSIPAAFSRAFADRRMAAIESSFERWLRGAGAASIRTRTGSAREGRLGGS